VVSKVVYMMLYLRAICLSVKRSARSSCLVMRLSAMWIELLGDIEAGNCYMTHEGSNLPKMHLVEDYSFQDAATDTDLQDLGWIAESLYQHGELAQDYYADWKASFADSNAPINATLDVLLDEIVASVDVGQPRFSTPSKLMRSVVDKLHAQPVINGDPLFALRALLQPAHGDKVQDDSPKKHHGAQFRLQLVHSTVAAVLQGALASELDERWPMDESFVELTGKRPPRRHSQQPDANMQRLSAMLLEVHAKTSALLQAGVTSKEVFACIVDNIMNMAPEIILQVCGLLLLLLGSLIVTWVL
jgi:hypothetical protein